MDWRLFLKLWVVIMAIAVAIASGVGVAIILVKTVGSLLSFFLAVVLVTGLAALMMASKTDDNDEDD